MRRFFTNKAFLFLTLAFVLLAVVSFVAFGSADAACKEFTCTPAQPDQSKGEIILDLFSRRLLSLASIH